MFRVLEVLLFDVFIRKIETLSNRVKARRIGRTIGSNFRFVPQGPGGFEIIGDLKNFSIDSTSHLKSNTTIECSGGVSIGRYFHTGRGLTIFSTNHNYDSPEMIPYDNQVVAKKVIVKDFVWAGANVTIVPGVTIGEGAVLGAGAVITKSVPDHAIVGGNPAKILKYRNIEHFKKLKQEGRYHI